MESQYRVRATHDGNLDSIQPENLAPEIQIDVIPDVTSGIIPISVTVKDPESQPVDIEFKFTSGFDLTVTTSVPKISISLNSYVGEFSNDFSFRWLFTGLTK